MSTSEPDLETNSSETASPKLDWRSPRTWAFFIADAAYGGAITGVFAIVAYLVTGLSHEMKAGSLDGWWVAMIVMVLLQSLHRIILEIWVFPDKALRQIDFEDALPDDGTRLGFLYYSLAFVPNYCLGLATSVGVIAIAQRFFALPGVGEAPLLTAMIFANVYSGTLLKLLAYRTRRRLGS